MYLYIQKETYHKIRNHVISSNLEGAAFAYARSTKQNNSLVFECFDWDPVDDNGFESRSEFHLMLTDRMRAHIIKRAHDLRASLVEFHSHSNDLPVKFSLSDLQGFGEFIPHVWWRLDDKPYVAVVFNESSFDGLIWHKNPTSPEQLKGIIVNEQYLNPTKLTLKEANYNEFK